MPSYASRCVKQIRESKQFKAISDISVIHWLYTVVPSLIVPIHDTVVHKPVATALERFFVWFGILIFTFEVAGGWKKGRKARWALLIPPLGLASIVITWAIVRVPIYAPFEDTVATYKNRLGGPISSPVYSQEAVEARHEHATVIWLESPQHRFYIMSTDSSTGLGTKLIRRNDPAYCLDVYDETQLRKMFPETPADKFPPWGGVACGWRASPQDWRSIGWRLWQCKYHRAAIVEQRFEHGVIVGAFNKAPSLTDHGTLFVFFDDDSWEPEGSQLAPPPCE